jgi:FMN reductase
VLRVGDVSIAALLRRNRRPGRHRPLLCGVIVKQSRSSTFEHHGGRKGAKMKVTVIVGNPKPASRTLTAATGLAQRLTGRPADNVIDVVTLGPGLLGWGDEAVNEAVSTAIASDVLIVASPTYKATYTGLLKLFLDAFSGGALAGVTAFPVMLGAGPGHAMAPDYLLKPVLVELGATCPMRGLYLLDSDTELTGATDWLTSAQSVLASLTGEPTTVSAS